MKNTIITVMLGMNRYSERDTSHPFNMSPLRGYNVMHLRDLTNRERTRSTPFYEIGKAVDEVRCEFTPVKDNIAFIFGRGTFGNGPEEDLRDGLLETMRNYDDSIKIMVGKSYGAVDTLRALKLLRAQNRMPTISLMILIDGYGVGPALTRVTKRYEERGPRRFVIPPNVQKAYGIVQRDRGFHGLLVGPPRDTRCHNYIVRQEHVDRHCHYYDHYSDGYRRRLKVCHKNMEEIVSTVPCCMRSKKLHTLNDIIKITLRRLWS